MGVIAQGQPRLEVKDPNWPAFRYPPGGAPADGKIFKSEDEVPKGWLDAPSVPAPPPPPPVVKGPPKREDPQAESRWRREAVENAQRLVAMEADRDTIGARVRELEGFLSVLRADADCPPALAKALDDLGIVANAPIEAAGEEESVEGDAATTPKRKRKPASE